jgi:phosphoketolase
MGQGILGRTVASGRAFLISSVVGALANCYLEGHYSEMYLDKSGDEAGLLKFFPEGVM